MNIWLVNHYVSMPGEVGGTRHFHLARELRDRGHAPLLVGSSFKHRSEPPRHRPALEVMEADGVDFLWLPTPSYRGNSLGRVWNMLVFFWAVIRARWISMVPRPDVIVGSSPHLFAALGAYDLARRLGVPFVLEVRDIWPESLVAVAGAPRWHPLVLLLGWIERFLYRRADEVIVLLPNADRHVKEVAPKARVTWLPNGVDFRRWCASVEKAPDREEGPFTVLYAGSHGRANALDSMVETAAILWEEGWGDRVLFRFVGRGPERDRLRATVSRRGLENVRFDDPVPKPKIYERLGEADALIASTLNLNLYRHGISPNKLVDYLSAARPIIFGSSASNDPVSEAGAGIVVAAEDSRAMAEAVKRLAQMPLAERRALGERGRRYAREHHSFEVLGGRLEEVLRRVVAGRARSGPRGD